MLGISTIVDVKQNLAEQFRVTTNEISRDGAGCVYKEQDVRMRHEASRHCCVLYMLGCSGVPIGSHVPRAHHMPHIEQCFSTTAPMADTNQSVWHQVTNVSPPAGTHPSIHHRLPKLPTPGPQAPTHHLLTLVKKNTVKLSLTG